MPKWTEIWWEAPMEGSVLSFLKAEWKVSDTDSVHWASSLVFFSFYPKFRVILLWFSIFQCRVLSIPIAVWLSENIVSCSIFILISGWSIYSNTILIAINSPILFYKPVVLVLLFLPLQILLPLLHMVQDY